MSLKPATKNYITKRITEAECLEAALWLKDGHIVAFPTETVYGLGACAFNDQAIKRIFTAKNRPQDNPLIVHITDDAQLKRVTMSIPKSFYRLRDLFWPGPLTCILQGHPDLPRCVSAGLNTVAVRMPAHPTAQKLINLVGEPLVAPSANLSGKPSATTADHVLEDFSGKIPFIIDGGQCSLGIESTVISLIEDKPYLLRPGSITIQALEHALGRQVHLPHKETKIMSPGMAHRHYAPVAPVVLVFSEQEKLAHLAIPKKRLILSRDPVREEKMLSAYSFYSYLRLADLLCCEEILILCDPLTQLDTALMDRILRASGRL